MAQLCRILVLVAATLLCAAAGAQPKNPSDADKATARKLLDEGDKKLSAGDLKAAHEAYKAADAIMGVPTTGLALGKVQLPLRPARLMGRRQRLVRD